jgi:hypothetical protein
MWRWLLERGAEIRVVLARAADNWMITQALELLFATMPGRHGSRRAKTTDAIDWVWLRPIEG